MNEFNSINPHTSFGVVSITQYKDGIKLISNSGIVLWEQYLADHPVFKNSVERFTLTVESVVYAKDQNAIIVACRLSETKNPMFYLAAYDATSGLPIYDQTVSNPNIVSIYEEEQGLLNEYSDRISLAYNEYNQTLIVYTTTLASRASRYFKMYSFDRYNLASPFNQRKQSSYLNWTLGSAPDAPSSNDFLIDVAIDQKTGLVFGMFQSTSTSSASRGRAVYVVPFNERFSSLRRATGAYISNITESRTNTTKPSLISPSTIYRSNDNDLSSGIWYGFFVEESDTGSTCIYRYAIKLNTNDPTTPSIETSSAQLVANVSDINSVKFDEYENFLVMSHVNDDNNLTNNVFVYEDLSCEQKTFPSNSKWDKNNFNVTFANESGDDKFKIINSSLGYFEQSTDTAHSIIFQPTPMIDINYRAQLIGIASTGSSLYANQVADEVLSSFSETELNVNPDLQTPMTGDGLWALYTAETANIINTEDVVISNIVKSDYLGTITFDIDIPYQANNLSYVNHIPNVKVSGFKTIISPTTIVESPLDVNRFNYVESINPDSSVLLRHVRPNNFTLEQIKKSIYEVVVEKPIGFSTDNIILDEETFIYNYIDGTITIPNVKVNLWYDRSGNLNQTTISIYQNFVLDGFYEAEETSIYNSTALTAPRFYTISDFFDVSTTFEYYLYNHMLNAPIEFFAYDDFEYDKTIGENVIIDNHNGTLRVKELYLKKWNDAEGKLHNELSRPYEIYITNFINVPNATSVRSEYLQYLPQVQPTDLSIDDIKEIIYQITMNAPNDFSVDNISFASDPIYNNLDGTIKVTPVLNNTYNESGFTITEPITMNEVTIRGFKAVESTHFSENWNIGGYRKYPSDYIQDEQYNDAKELIASNAFNLPYYHYDSTKDFIDTEDVIIESIESDNINGTLNITFRLQKYYDEDGIYHNDENFPLTTISITGFKRICGETWFKSTYLVAYTNVSPQNVTERELKKFILAYGYNMHVDIKEADISFHSITRLPVEGKIEIEPTLSKYYDENGNPQTDAKVFPKIIIDGLKKIQPTDFDQDRWILGTSEKVAQEVAQNENELKELLLLKIINAPTGFTTRNIIFQQDPLYSNTDGTITVVFKINKYYDEDGFLRTDDNSKVFTLVISGFYIANSRTDISTNIQVHMPYTTPQEMDIADIKDVLIDNFTNLPPSFDANNIILNHGNYTFSNLDGILVIPNLTINYYFDNDISIQNSQKVFPSITITGFKKVQPTNLPLDNWDVGNSEITASDFAIDHLNIKNLIAQRIENKPIDFDPETDITIANVNPVDSLGAIELEVSLNKYYDGSGILVNTGWQPQKIIISGFLTINGATYFDNEINANQPTILASSKQEDEIKNILLNGIKNSPSNLTIDNIVELDYEADNINGVIKVTPTLNKWYNDLGILQNTNKVFDEIRVYNFKIVKPTVVINNWNTGNSLYTPQTALLPENFDHVKNIIFNNISNTPDGFSINDIVIVGEPIANNLDGTITITFTLNNFFDEQGNLSSTGFAKTTVTISGYRKTMATIIPSTGWSVGDASKLPSDYNSDSEDLKRIIYNMIDYLPVEPRYDYVNNIILSNLLPNNATGKLTLTVKVKNGYDQYGNLNPSGDAANLNKTITIDGFATISPTTINDTLLPNQRDTIASSIDNTSLSNLIYKYRGLIFNNLPIGFSASDIELAERISDNKNGRITLDIKIHKYYESATANLVDWDKEPLSRRVILSGFAKCEPTIAVENQIIIPDLNRFLATDFNNVDQQILQSRWKEIIMNYSYKFYQNLPPKFNEENIVGIEIINNNNAEGSCVVKVSINNYFKNDQLVSQSNSSDQLTAEFVVLGFMINKSTTANHNVLIRSFNINNNETLAQNILLSDIKDNIYYGLSWKSIVQDNVLGIFNNLPTNFNPDTDVVDVEYLTHSNLTGSVQLRISIKNYFNSDGNLDTGLSHDFNVTLTGFKKVSQTTYKKNIIINDLQNIFATDLNDDDLFKLIFDNTQLIFNNTLPQCTIEEFEQYFVIDDFIADNNQSKLTISANLGYYFDANGELIKDNNQPLKIDFEIYGFKQNQTVTIIRDLLELTDVNELLASNQIKDDNYIANLVITYRDILFVNAPENLSLTDFNITNVNSNNANGTISFTLNLFTYYNEDGILITPNSQHFTPLTKDIVITGYQVVSASSIGIVPITSNPNITAHIGDPNLLPSYFQNLEINQATEQLLNLVTSRLSGGSINGIENDRIMINDFQYDVLSSNDGEHSLVVTFVLSNFITLEDGLVEAPTTFKLTITGFGEKNDNILTKDAVYYITIVGVVYLSLLSSGIIVYIIYRFIRWKKGKV